MSKTPLKVIAGAPDRPAVIGDIKIACYVLEDETRVLSQRGLTSFLGLNPDAGFRMPQFLASRAIKPFVPKDLAPALDAPIVFQNPSGGGVAYGYKAEVLELIVDTVMNAELAGALPVRYAAVAEYARELNRAFRHAGVIGWIDEATGYQEIRTKRAIQTILEAFIAKNLQPWNKTFPYEFYELLYKLRGWDGPDGHKRTHQVAKDTNDLIYSRIAPGVLEELQRLNPPLPGGGRKWRHHQWFTPDPGYILLNQHIAGVMALMRASANWGRFYSALQRAYPRLRDQLGFDFGDGA